MRSSAPVYGFLALLSSTLLLPSLSDLVARPASGGVTRPDQRTSPESSLDAWKPLRIGGGGFLTGLDISADGSTRVVRTDTYGGYVWDSTQWRQLVSMSSMPTEDVGLEKNSGIYEIRVAPRNPRRLYMSYRGHVYRSDDSGDLWTRTAFSPVDMDANDSYRTFGPKMGIDPANPDVVYVGTPKKGLFVTVNGGASWQQVEAVPVGRQQSNGWPGITGIAFDANSGVSGSRTRVVFAASYGNGVWRTSDGGASWEMAGGPSRVVRATVAVDGAFYATSHDGSPNTVWRYSEGGWQNITPPGSQSWHTVVTDPFDSSRLVLGTDGGYLIQSRDRGTSWLSPFPGLIGFLAAKIRPNRWGGTIWSTGRRATDIPWLAETEESYMSNGDMRFDPVTPDRLWFAEGIGVWTTSVSPSPASITWTSQSLGIEQLVANAIVAPPGGKPVLASWDRALFLVDDPDVFPSTHGPTRRLNMGWAVDYASTDFSFLAALVDWWGKEESCYSTNGGRTWTIFPTFPAWPDRPIGGSIAASTPDNIVWVGSNGAAPYYTKDRGQTWHPITLPGVPDTPAGWKGLHSAYYLNRHIVAADRVNAGTFYVYHSPHGMYRSVDGGSTWGLVHAGEILDFSGFNAKLRSVPGKAGHLFFTAGQQSGAPPSGAFMRSMDGGATWTALPNVLEVYAFGFGKEAPAASYPAIFIAGWVKNVYGIWRSDTEGRSWTQIGDFPLGSLDEIRALEGDKNVYGAVYLGFAGSGYAYRRN